MRKLGSLDQQVVRDVNDALRSMPTESRKRLVMEALDQWDSCLDADPDTMFESCIDNVLSLDQGGN
jgi:hypothetical protein